MMPTKLTNIKQHFVVCYDTILKSFSFTYDQNHRHSFSCCSHTFICRNTSSFILGPKKISNNYCYNSDSLRYFIDNSLNQGLSNVFCFKTILIQCIDISKNKVILYGRKSFLRFIQAVSSFFSYFNFHFLSSYNLNSY